MKTEDTAFLVGLIAAGAAAARLYRKWGGLPPPTETGPERPRPHAPAFWARDVDAPTRPVHVELLAPPREHPLHSRTTSDVPF